MKKILYTIMFIASLVVPTRAANLDRIELGRFKLTAYSGSHQKHTKIPVTASGKIAKAGRTVAVDPRVIRMGARIDIQGVGVRTAEDKGSAIKGKIIDVYVASVPLAWKFGVKYASVALIFD